MLTKIVKIGNSKGIRLPKKISDDMFPNNLAELTILDNKIEISSAINRRQNWEKQFKDSEPIVADFVSNDFDREEWEW